MTIGNLRNNRYVINNKINIFDTKDKRVKQKNDIKKMENGIILTPVSYMKISLSIHLVFQMKHFKNIGANIEKFNKPQL